MQNSHRQIVLLLIAVFTLSQLAILVIFGYTPYPDSDGYILLAEQSIAQGEPYPVVNRLHDYPFLWNIGAINSVALSLWLFKSITPLLVVYCLMKGATAWFFYQLTKSMVKHRIAIIALLLYMLYPANYGEATSALSELPFMFFIMLGLWLCISKKQYFWGGIFLAIANWYRPMGIVFLLALLIYLFYTKRRTLRPLAGYVAMIALIGSMSYLRTGLFLYQAKTGWMALTDYSTQHSTASMQVRDHQEWNVSQKDSAWQSLFFDWLKDHPTEYVAQIPKKLVNTYVSDNINMCTFIPQKKERKYMYDEVSMPTLISSFPQLSSVQWLTVLNLCYYYLLLLLAVLSLRYLRLNSYLLPLSVILLGMMILLLAGHGEARFHQPLMPFIILLATMYINKRIWKG